MVKQNQQRGIMCVRACVCVCMRVRSPDCFPTSSECSGWVNDTVCVVAAAQQELTGDLESNETNTEESSQVAVQSSAGKKSRCSAITQNNSRYNAVMNHRVIRNLWEKYFFHETCRQKLLPA